MCGVVGFTGRRQAAPILLEGLEKLEYRGYDSAGIAVTGNKIEIAKTTGRIQSLIEKTDSGANIKGSAGIGHTRWATHGAPNFANAHPHLSADGKFAVVHNGIIENYPALREELSAAGCKFTSETDTEVIAHLLSYYYRGNFLQTVIKTVSRLEGSYALGVVCSDFPDRIFAARRSCPLIAGLGDGENFLASDVTALISHTRDVIYFDEGDIAELTSDGIAFYDASGNPVQRKREKITWNIEAAEKSGYDKFMLKEIMEQPRCVEDTVEPRIKNGKIILDDVRLTADDLDNTRRIVITGCGSAAHAGYVGKYVLEELLRIPVEVDIASELRYRNPVIDRHTLVIVLSQSGETADTIAALKEAKSRGARTLAIVNVVGSSIAKLADDVLYTRAGPEIAVATTKGYTTQLALLYLFAVYAADKTGRLGSAQYYELISELRALPGKMRETLSRDEQIPQLAKRFHDRRSVFFIGRNIDYSVALEGSLKLKEISYIHSEAYAAGELKHGTISLIEPGRLVVALSCCDSMFEKLLSNIREVKARGASVIAAANDGQNRIVQEADAVMFVPRTHPLFVASLEVLPLQLFAYYVAKENGCDIDKPRNLAKSVTVE